MQRIVKITGRVAAPPLRPNGVPRWIFRTPEGNVHTGDGFVMGAEFDVHDGRHHVVVDGPDELAAAVQPPPGAVRRGPWTADGWQFDDRVQAQAWCDRLGKVTGVRRLQEPTCDVTGAAVALDQQHRLGALYRVAHERNGGAYTPTRVRNTEFYLCPAHVRALTQLGGLS